MSPLGVNGVTGAGVRPRRSKAVVDAEPMLIVVVLTVGNGAYKTIGEDVYVVNFDSCSVDVNDRCELMEQDKFSISAACPYIKILYCTIRL